MTDKIDTVELTVEEYNNLLHKAALWDFYGAQADFEVDHEEYDEDQDIYTADPDAEVIIYTNKTLREENDFLAQLNPSDECCEEVINPCEGCTECAGCCEKKGENNG